MPSRLVTVEDIVLGVNIAASVLGVTSLLGLGLACARRGGCAHNFFGGLYFVASIPVWVALGFVCAFALAFRDEAELLVGQYWNCLRTARTTDAVAGGRAWEVAAAVYESITITAALLLGADLLLLLGLYAAGGLIGWSGAAPTFLLPSTRRPPSSAPPSSPSVLASAPAPTKPSSRIGRSSPSAAPSSSSLVSVSRPAPAPPRPPRPPPRPPATPPPFRRRRRAPSPSFAGLCGSRCRSRCLLHIYTLSIFVLLVVVGGGLWAVAAGGLDQGAFLAEHWVYVQQSTGVSEAAARTLLDRHWTILLIANCLLVFVLGVSLVAACVLRRALDAKISSTASERATLLDDDDDELP